MATGPKYIQLKIHMSDKTHCTKYNLAGQIQILTYNFKLVEVSVVHYSRYF